MLNQSTPSSKKRTLWTENEDKLLQQLVNRFLNERLGWKKISQSLRKQGYDRNTKACRERFFNHLDNTFNKTELTTQELDKLFELIKIHGNKWTCIAEELNHRTDQDIKNKFYAHVKKVFRRLLKATFQTTETSIMTAKLQPLLISSIFCSEQDLDQKQLPIQSDMKDLFQNLIRQNKSIQQGEQINEETKEQVQQITTYLDKENQLYMQNKITRKENKKIIKAKHNIKKTQVVHNEFQQQQILKKIQKKQPIFVCSQKKLEIPIMDFDTNFENDINQFQFDKMLENGYPFQPQQFISSVPFYWNQPSNKLESSHQSELSYMAIQSNSLNYSTIWNI